MLESRLDELQTLILATCAEVLGSDNAAPTDNFFELGGDSLSAQMFVQILSERLGNNIPIGIIFDATDLGDIIKAISAQVER